MHAISGEPKQIGARLKAARKQAGMVVYDLAKQFRDLERKRGRNLPSLESLERTIRSHEAGDHAPGDRYRLLWAAALDTTEEELFGPGADAEGSVEDRIPPHAWDDDVERRLLLQIAALSVGASAVGGAEPVRQLLALAVDSEPRDLEDWQLTVSDHLYAVRTRTPAEARDSLAVDLLAIQRQIAAGAGEKIELLRVVAALATLHANILTRLGDHGTAIHWWRTAKTAADATDDLDLRLLVRGFEASFGLYGQRDPATVIKLLDRAERIAGRRSCALLDRQGIRARALSLLGRDGEARHALNLSFEAAETTNQSDGPLPDFWRPDVLHFAKSWVYAHGGDETATDQARDEILAGTLSYQFPAQVRLHEAHCAVVNGGTETGARLATEILDALPAAQHSHMITETGRMVLRAVPLDQRERPAVRDLRALTAGPGPAALG